LSWASQLHARGGRLLLVNFSKKRNRLTLWARVARPVFVRKLPPFRIEPFVRKAGFHENRAEFFSGVISSEVVLAWEN
jgi:hypothetical protein